MGNRVVSTHSSWEKAQASALDRSRKCSERWGGLWRFRVRRLRHVSWVDRHNRWLVEFVEHRGGVA